jgi:hypothetical protein
VQTLNSALTVFAKSMPSVSHNHTSDPSHRASSPPPPIEDKLEIFLEAFRKAKGLTADIVTPALYKFHEVAYSPDAICEATPRHLEEISGLMEGHVLAMKKFAHQWCGKIDAKRVKGGM